MRSSICEFVSDAFYESRLSSHKSTNNRKLHLINTNLPNEGIVVIHANHEDCAQKSEEEAKIINEKYIELLGQEFIDGDNIKRQITEDEILVVSPYNVQVNHLEAILPTGARVGTVDKFQGQEAPIVLVSMVTSSYENITRNVEFLFSEKRLNVAISRAQCLAVIVFNSKLLETPCRTITQMKLVNKFCRLNDYALNINYQ